MLNIRPAVHPQVASSCYLADGTYGHAMVVEGVNGDGSIHVSQYNYDFSGDYSTMTVSASLASSFTIFTSIKIKDLV